MENLGAKLKKIRESRDLTSQEVAQKIGISRSYLSMIENNRRLLPKIAVKRLARMFRVSVDQVYSWYLQDHLKKLRL